MGQYWKVVNLDRREWIDPHKLGCGLKLMEQFCAYPGTAAPLTLLLAAFPESRGGGDPRDDEPAALAIAGRWAGDRVIWLGDYAEDDDLPPEKRRESDPPLSEVYGLCVRADDIIHHRVDDADVPRVFTDISDLCCAAIEEATGGKFVKRENSGFREYKPDAA